MPAAIPILIGLSAASTAVQVVGQVKAGNAAKKAGEAQRESAESQAQLADYNASVADLQEADAISRGRQEANEYRALVRNMVGSQRAGFAAGNIDVSYGTAVDVQTDARFLGELDALTIRTNAAREAWGYQVQAVDLRKRATIARKEGVYLEAAGRQQQTASRFAAAGSIIGGASSVLQLKYGQGR
jgi:hypothetical protein